MSTLDYLLIAAAVLIVAKAAIECRMIVLRERIAAARERERR